MTWFRSDDDLPEHPKSDVLEAACPTWADLAAAWMTWHHMGCDCARRRTDGAFVRSRAHRAVRLPADVVDASLTRLVAAGFLEVTGPDAFAFHGWDEYQPTKAELDAEKRAGAERQKAWRMRQRAARNAVTNGVTHAVTDGVTDGVTHGVRNAGVSRVTSRETSPETSAPPVTPPRPVPSRPVPQSAESESSTPPAADDAGASPAAPDAPEAGQDKAPAADARSGAVKARKSASTDTLPPKPGTGPARALEALRACPTLRAIVTRPNALCDAIGGEAFPAVDVPGEIRRAEAWLVANPKNKKSDGGRFLTGWLTRAQDRAPPVGGGPSGPAAPDDWQRAFEAEMQRINAAKGGRNG